MKTPRRSFLQAAAAMLAGFPLVGPLLARPPEKIANISDAMQSAAYQLCCKPEWNQRVLEVQEHIVMNFIGANEPRLPALRMLSLNTLIYGNAFAAWDELWRDHQIKQFNHNDVELTYDLRTAELLVSIPNSSYDQWAKFGKAISLEHVIPYRVILPQSQRVLLTKATHFQLSSRIGVPNKGWALPPYFEPERQQMPTVCELICWYESCAWPTMQKFMAAKPW